MDVIVGVFEVEEVLEGNRVSRDQVGFERRESTSSFE